MNHRPRLTAGDYAESLRKADSSASDAIAKASLPLSVSELAQATGLTESAVLAAVRSQPRKFFEKDGLVQRVARA